MNEVLHPRQQVYEALRLHHDAGSIACVTGLTRDRVQTEISRLADKLKIRKTDAGWFVSTTRCLLAEMWTGVK